jgi:hypothetical protein
MKEKKSEKSSGKNKGSSDRSNNPKNDKNIVNEQEQQNVVNPQQELHEQDRPSGDYVSEREMSRQSQEKPDTESGNNSKKKTNSVTNAEQQKEKFEE